MNEKLTTVSDLAAYLNVPTSRIYQFTRQKGSEQIPHIRVGRYCRFFIPEVLDWLERKHKEEDND
jgi:excisionase family DNA binding protein